MQFFRAFWVALFPSRCAVCGELDPAAACAPCAARLMAIGSPAPALHRACWMHAAFPYQWPVRELIIAGKRPGGEAGLRLLATLAAERLAGVATAVEAGSDRRSPTPALPEVIVPVPLSRRRERQRGFNQAQTIAAALGTALSVPAAALLERTRDTGTQVGRRPRERAAGVRDAFRVVAEPPPHVWVVDDVLTSGSTLAEAALMLRGAGAREVTGVALAAAAAG